MSSVEEGEVPPTPPEPKKDPSEALKPDVQDKATEDKSAVEEKETKPKETSVPPVAEAPADKGAEPQAPQKTDTSEETKESETVKTEENTDSKEKEENSEQKEASNPDKVTEKPAETKVDDDTKNVQLNEDTKTSDAAIDSKMEVEEFNPIKEEKNDDGEKKEEKQAAEEKTTSEHSMEIEKDKSMEDSQQEGQSKTVDNVEKPSVTKVEDAGKNDDEVMKDVDDAIDDSKPADSIKMETSSVPESTSATEAAPTLAPEVATATPAAEPIAQEEFSTSVSTAAPAPETSEQSSPEPEAPEPQKSASAQEESAPAPTPASNESTPSSEPVPETPNEAAPAPEAAPTPEAAQEQAEGSVSSKDLPYSTRGRDRDAGSGGEGWERGAREALEEIGRVKETSPATMGASFLESLTEEERRTRTRFLPDVDGMHVLRKNEVKEDLASARSLLASSTSQTAKKSKGKRSRSEDDSMDVDDDGGISPSEDDRSSDMGKAGMTTVEFLRRDLVVPSSAFLAPSVSPSTSSNDDSLEGREANRGNLSRGKKSIQSPLLVDAATAFNPPRPPESIGAKKKHRMLRWERRPEDVEVDLNNYRKTVQRTRHELHNAEAEYERLETIDAHLRWHYMGQLNLINEEYIRLNESMGSVQQECVKAADLLTSRTRSRGAGKGTYLMRDVLNVLKTRGTESLENETVQVEPSSVLKPFKTISGIGGLAPSSFDDWNDETKLTPCIPASAWLVPGEKVDTPYGEGVVVSIEPASHATIAVDESVTDAKSKNVASKVAKSKRKKGQENKEKKNQLPAETGKLQSAMIPARVEVELAYGKGYFGISSVSPIDNPSSFSDGKLAKRWKSMVETAVSVSGCTDLEGMTLANESLHISAKDEAQMDIDEGSGDSDPSDVSSSRNGSMGTKSRVVPFGSSLLPTSVGRGNVLNDMPVSDIEKGLHVSLFNGKGVLGTTTNPGVPNEFKQWETNEQEYLTLQASVLQLRNALIRQKRIRLLNERTSIATSDKSHRAEELVSEMRADLKSLKHRLEEELAELGIDEESAEGILSSYYYGQDYSGDGSEASPIKRTRRSLSRDGAEGDLQESSYGNDIDQGSYGDNANDNSSGDELAAQRPPKKFRLNQ